MSRVYFHSPSGMAELRGSERAWASSLVNDMACGFIARADQDALFELIPVGHYLREVPEGRKHPHWDKWLRTAWCVGLDLNWRGHTLDAWTFTLNTALLLGNDPVRFMARMHGQCEIHGWVDGRNRVWLADIIGRGRASGLYRHDAGWEDVAAFLGQRDDEPVVMSYSVCDGFPNAYASDWTGTGDDWYDLPEVEQWDRGMRYLRSMSGLELSPDDWTEMRFGHGLSVIDLTAPDRDERLRSALGVIAR